MVGWCEFIATVTASDPTKHASFLASVIVSSPSHWRHAAAIVVIGKPAVSPSPSTLHVNVVTV